jgi:serine/threonine-protein kinase
VLDVGGRLADYEILAPLKEGGMASLFLAEKRGAAGFSRNVVIKVVRPDLSASSSFVDMFLDEARLCSRIHHPNVVHVEELGERDGLYYLVMEHVDGCSLAQFLTALSEGRRRTTHDLAGHVAIKIAEGLHAAHEAVDGSGQALGVVHRDVSPQNVLVSYTGHVKLIDFGVAKARTRGDGSGAIAGKLSYMAPEQAYARAVDRRTDVYALGILLWEMLTMQRLFAAKSDVLLLQRVRQPKVVRPSTIDPTISPALDDAVMHALAPDPADRPATTLELAKLVAAALPAAAAYQPSQLSEVVRAVMASSIVAERAKLPPRVADRLGRTEVENAPRAIERNTVLTAREGTWFVGDLSALSRTPTAVSIERETTRRSRWPWIIALGGAVALAGGAAALAAIGALGSEPHATARSAAEPTIAALEPPAALPDAGGPMASAQPEPEPERGAERDSEQETEPRDAPRRTKRRAAMREDTAQADDPAMRTRIDGVTIVSDF